MLRESIGNNAFFLFIINLLSHFILDVLTWYSELEHLLYTTSNISKGVK